MNDPIGTVRREDHDGDGYSIWALVANSVVLMTGPPTPTLRPMWRCVHSTAPGNLGAQFSPAQVQDAIDSWRVIGAVPGTPAATTQDQALVKLADRLDYEAAICGHRDKGRHMLRIEQIAKELRQLAALSPAPGNKPDGTAEREVVADFCAERERYITSINNCAPDNYHDYYRWQGHAEARRQLAQRLERAASVAQEGGDQ